MQAAHHRHDISDKAWGILEPHLPGREGVRGVTARDNRLFINAVFWILRPNACYSGYRCRLHTGLQAYKRDRC